MPRKAVTLRLDGEMIAALERWAADELLGFDQLVDRVLREALDRAGRGRGMQKHPFR